MEGLFATPARKRFDPDSLKEELNAEQCKAVLHNSGPLLILAGAGSGKTRVITYRIARLISEGLAPRRVIALTFTNKAAAEMKERTQALSGASRFDLWISTFHSACLRMLRRHAELLNYPRDFTVCDSQDQTRLIKACLKELNIEEKQFPAREIGSLISRFKSRLKGPAQAEAELNPRRYQEFLKCFFLYESKLQGSRMMDFDDLLVKSVELLKKETAVREMYRDRFEHMLVDEFQDTNIAQYEFVRLLINERRNICVVGDDDQSIYQWRGAEISNILNFEKDFIDTSVIVLERNYRSTQNILKCASAIVSRNPHRKEKNLWTDNVSGEKINLYSAADELDEALNVVQTIKRLQKVNRISLNDMAIFYRTNSQSRALEDAIRAQGYSYQIYGALKFYERKEIKDILAYFRVALNPFDAISFKRIIGAPPRGIGAATVEKLENASRSEGVSLPAVLDIVDDIAGLNAGARKKLESFREILSKIRAYAGTMTVADAIERSLEVSGYMDWLTMDTKSESLNRAENLTELVNAAKEFQERTGESSVAAFLDQSALAADSDKDDLDGQAVKLMTVHISKGLEFPVVFITGLEENLFPHSRSMGNEKQLQEERRLMYVGMTRSRERLFLSYAKRRRIFGEWQSNEPSSFIFDLPSETIQKQESDGAHYNRTASPATYRKPAPLRASIRKREKEQNQENVVIDGLKVRLKVSHPTFKVGVIRKIEGRGDNGKITVYFPSFGEKKLVKKFAKLTIIEG